MTDPGPRFPRDWFTANTFDASDFDHDGLVAAKAAAGVSVSVVLPARNEAETIGGILEAVTSLSGALVDEIVVMDAGSEDATAEIAAAAGARVHVDRQVLADHGPALGKGDALWRSLTVTSGDLVVFVDADIRNPDPRFVSGLLAPLLARPEIQFVKAYYERPLEVGAVLQPSGGGRVTELLARPLLNLLWPELSGLIQPLSGEYAARRSLLETLPFFTGYGVELGLLVDTLLAVGLNGLAQVDLTERIHRNQSIDALSRMSFGILEVALARLSQQRHLGLAGLPEHYTQFSREDGRVVPVSQHLPVVERPPHRPA